MSKTVHIKAKEVLNDIDSGMHKLDLMKKYNLSTEGLESLFRKLETQGPLNRLICARIRLMFAQTRLTCARTRIEISLGRLEMTQVRKP